MKIVIITRSMWAGGAERVIAELVKYFNDNNVKSNIITIDKGPINYDIPKEVAIHAIGEVSNNKYLDKFLRYKELRKQVKKLKPDIVLSLPEDIGIYVIPSLIGTKIPVVVSERNNPWVMPWKKETRLLRKIFYPLLSGVIFQTEQAASFFTPKIRKKGIVLPNPVDLERIPEPWVGERRKEIVSAGRLDKQKNFPLLIRSFSEFYKNHPDYILTIYGEGNLRSKLEELAASLLPKEAYSFPGRTPDLLEKMKGAKMFILSSDYEGMPNVVIEAMAVGMPVISTDCPSGGPATLIENGINGILIPTGDLDSLYKAMCMVAESESLAWELSSNAKNIRDRLDTNIIAEEWVQYLKEVASNKL